MPDKNEKKIYILYFELLCFKTMADKKLSEDIVKLKKLEQDGICDSRPEKFENREPNTHPASAVEGGASSLSAMKSKKRKSVPAIEGTAMLDIEMESDHSADKCSDRIEVGCAPLNIQQVSNFISIG